MCAVRIREIPPADDGPAPMPVAEFLNRARAELVDLLQHGGDTEPPFQDFLERHPLLVPIAFPQGMGHAPWMDALISQPRLQGSGHYVPDFMWIATNSRAIAPVFVEIERSGKSWLKQNNEPSASLTASVKQLTDWRTWLERPANQLVFMDTYEIPSNWRRMRAFRPQFWLIYGRRLSGEADRIGVVRDTLDRAGITALSWDHVLEHPGFRDQESCPTIRSDGLGRFKVVRFPACARLEPNDPNHFAMTSGWREAIAVSDGMSEERRAYLLGRVDVLEHWASRNRT